MTAIRHFFTVAIGLIISLQIGAPPTAHGETVILSGGPRESDYLSADDVLKVFVDGAEVPADTSQYANDIPPVRLEVNDGSSLRIQAIDVFGLCRGMSALYLHSSKCDRSIKLFEGRNDGCNNWPAGATFFDQTFTISLAQLSCEPVTFTKTSNIPADSKGVGPGDKITYTLQTLTNDTAKRIRILDSVPTGTVLIPGSLNPPGKRRGIDLSWEFTNSSNANVSFTVQVNDYKKLPKRLSAIKNQGKTIVVTGKKTNRKTARVDIPLIKPCIAAGRISDVIMDFPKRTVVTESRPVSGAEVTLIGSQGTRSLTVTSDKDGKYSVSVDDPGTYTLEVKAKASRYSEGTRSVVPDAVTVKQLREVTFTECSGKPTRTDVAVPRSIVSTAAEAIKNLNDLDASIPGTITDLARSIGFELPFTYNTTNAQAFIDSVISAAPQFPGVFKGSGARDGWNSMIRLNAAMILLHNRFRETVVLSDDIAKGISLIVTVEAIKKLTPKAIARIKEAYPDSSFVAKSDAKTYFFEAIKVGVMAFGVGQVLPWALDQAGLKGAKKARAIEITAKAIRYGFNYLTRQATVGDVIFEVIFNTLRLGILTTFVEADIAGTQERLDEIVNLASTNTYADNTNTVFAYLDRFNGKISNRYLQAHDAASNAFKIVSFIRGFSGVWEKTKRAWVNINGWEQWLRDGLDTFLKPVVTASTWTGYITAFSAVLGTIELNYQDSRGLLTAAFSGVVSDIGTEELQLPPLADETDTDTPETLPLTQTRAAEVVQLRKTLKLIDAAVDRGLTSGYLARRDELLQASRATFAYFEGLRTLGEGAAPQLKSKLFNSFGTFVTAETLAQNLSAMHLVQLELWALGPTPAGKKAVNHVYKELLTALNDAAKKASRIEGALAGAQAPGFFQLTEINQPVEPVKALVPITITIQCKNAGDLPLDASVIELKPGVDTATNAPRMTLVSPATVNLPALAPGQSVDVAWVVKPSAVTVEEVIDYQVIATISNNTSFILDGSVRTIP